MERKSVLITICGRAGSKGFRNKNLKIFDGHPLCYYSLAAAELFCKQRPDLDVDMALNTDSPELRALVAQQYPEVVSIERPEELAGDTVAKMAVFQHTLRAMEARTGRQYDVLIDLDITSPMRKQGDVAGAYAVSEARPDYAVVFSVTEARRNPWFNQLRIVDDHVEQAVKHNFTARQQAPQVLDVNASINVFRRSFLLESEKPLWWEGKCGAYHMFDTGILDIDCEEDYRLMEAIAQHLYATNPDFAAVREQIRRA